MPCWCSVEITADFEDYDKRDAVCEELIKYVHKSEEDGGVGIDLGMVDNWLFDTAPDLIQAEDNIVRIAGTVRWSLTVSQARGLIQWFLDRGAHDVVIDYEEASNCLLGRYTYSNGLFRLLTLPESNNAWLAYGENEIGLECLVELMHRLNEVEVL